MFLYCLIVALLSVLTVLEDKGKIKNIYKKIVFIVMILFLLVVSALRKYTVGVDTSTYWKAYSKYDKISLKDSTRYETGFFLLIKLLNLISSNPQLLLVVSSLIINVAVGYFVFTNSKKPFFSLLIYVLLNYWFSYMNVMRQALAIAFILFGFNFLKKNNWKNDIIYFVFVLISIMFHQIGIVGIIIPFTRLIKPHKYSMLFVSVIGTLLFVFGAEIFNVATMILPMYKKYGETIFAESNYNAAFFKLILGILMLIYAYCGLKRKMFKNKFEKNFIFKKENVSENIFYNMVSIFVLFSYCVMNMVIFERLASFIAVFNIVVVPNAIDGLEYKNRDYAKCFLILVFVLYFLIIAIYRPNWSGCIPYEFYFE